MLARNRAPIWRQSRSPASAVHQLALRPLNYSWLLASVQGFLLIGAFYLFQRPISSTAAVVILAVLTVVMAARAEAKWGRIEKAAWLSLVLLIALVAIRANNQEESKRRQQFLSIVTGIKQSIITSNEQFRATESGETAILKTARGLTGRLGQTQTRLHLMDMDIKALRQGQTGQTQIIKEVQRDATRPLPDFPPEILRSLAEGVYSRLEYAEHIRTSADDAVIYPHGIRDTLSSERLAQDRKYQHDQRLHNYRNELDQILPEADTLRTLMLGKVSSHTSEDYRWGEQFQAALNGNIRDFSANSAADYLKQLENRMPK